MGLLSIAFTIGFLAAASASDRFNDNVANYALQSLNQLSNYDSPLILYDNVWVPNHPSGIYNLTGFLINPILSGINSINNITTHVRSVTTPDECYLEYSLSIATPIIRGQFNINGFIGSPIISFEGIGDFQIIFSKPINISCLTGFTSRNGFLQFENQFFLTNTEIDVEDAQLHFPGLGEHALLDTLMRSSIVQYIAQHYILNYDWSIFNAIASFTNEYVERDFQETKLLDIILSDRSDPMHPNHHQRKLIEKSNWSDNAVEERLCNFALESILSLSDSRNDPYPLETTYYLQHSRSALFPSGGLLSDLKLSGISTMFNVICVATTDSRTRFFIEFDMPNVTLSGTYNITGSIAGETSVSSTGEFTIRSEKGARFTLASMFENIDGYLFHEWNDIDTFIILSDTYESKFSGLLDGVDVVQEVAEVIIDSLGSSVFCPPDDFCLYDFITGPMVGLVGGHLQQRLREVPIVDIITLRS